MAQQSASLSPRRPIDSERGQRTPLEQTQQGHQLPPTFSSSATINTQFWLEHLPWRPTAAWATVAALLAIGGNPATYDWQVVLLVLLLADPLWGSIWRLAAGRDEILPLQHSGTRQRIWLPYLLPGSPAARLFDWNHTQALPLLFRVGLPSLLLSGAVALVLTPVALWMTGCVFLISILGWIIRRTLQSSTTFLHSLVTVTMPWLLTLSLFGAELSDSQWAIHLVLIALWTLHNWGEGRNLRIIADPLGLLLLAVAEIGMICLLIFLRAPFWLALLVILWLPTWLSVYYRRSVQHLNFIWLLAMLLSAWALGQYL
ncbi:MAG: hypothetical protein KDE58_02905 [Caldilineaceae bacterium]|nr:hypothetical protein [Caldilineaceae bacterium]